MARSARLLGALLALVVALAACTGPSPADALRSFLDALGEGDWETARGLMAADAGIDLLRRDAALDRPEVEEFAAAMFANLSYRLDAPRVNGDAAVVPASVTAPDVARILVRSVSEVLPAALARAFSGEGAEGAQDEAVRQHLIEALTDPDAPTVTTEVEVRLIKQDGQWRVVVDEALANALTGNALKAFGD